MTCYECSMAVLWIVCWIENSLKGSLLGQCVGIVSENNDILYIMYQSLCMGGGVSLVWFSCRALLIFYFFFFWETYWHYLSYHILGQCWHCSISIHLRAESPKSNQLGAERKRRPEFMTHYTIRPAGAKAFCCLLFGEMLLLLCISQYRLGF